ncbi:hypothetical protein [Paractinoplanes rishiriensis]|uniref:ABC transporter ATP-binding protein n=1 Tax=Paractinoplanes rishiriensis TaxID=1050105 RepID=A0A919N087_9ACTN|nr:hypothetical protein [Actinoplanes rishiriensis]GIE99305.1 hypothetical protein Ari01nite_67700 [Actinoplanes rishiriensis]
MVATSGEPDTLNPVLGYGTDGASLIFDGLVARACLARAVAHRPRYLLCDEATTMLDASTQAHVAKVIRETAGLGVLLVSHDAVLIRRWADRIEDLAA